MMRRPVTVLSILLITALLPSVTAHVPLQPQGEESLADAYEISDPTKSWVIYGELHSGHPHYYQFDAQAGQRIYLGLIIPLFEGGKDFTPSLVLMGPSLPESEGIPVDLEVPPGYGTLLIEGRLPPQATYEPFSPSTFYALGELDLSAPTSGTYYVAVISTQQGGNYGLVVGQREAFTIDEWILTPVSLIGVYMWEGQNLLLILAPMFLVLVAGLVLLAPRLKAVNASRKPFAWLGALAGLLFLGTGAVTLYQMVLSLTQAPLSSEVVITMVFVAIPLLLGTGVVRLSLRREVDLDRRSRLTMVVLGIAGLVVWAGLLVGPALAVAAGLLPLSKRAAIASTPEGAG